MKKTQLIVVAREQKEIGKVVCFADRGFAIKDWYYDENGNYTIKFIDGFDVNSGKLRNYERIFRKQLSKCLGPETKVVYIESEVDKFIKRLK